MKCFLFVVATIGTVDLYYILVFQKYKHDIPVLLLDDTVVLKHRFSGIRFKESLEELGVDEKGRILVWVCHVYIQMRILLNVVVIFRSQLTLGLGVDIAQMGYK